MSKFQLVSNYKPTGDQPQAIAQLTKGLKAGLKHQVLLGVTGSGKTFSMANVIHKTQLPTLVISHNKTLAAQLYQEYRDFFPENAVEYFVSYYDYYQPEVYMPQTDTYIEKESNINEFIDKLRLSATTSLMTRDDVIVVASVSCIYNLGSPIEYAERIIELKNDMTLRREDLAKRLIQLHYSRNDYDFKRATFRARGDILDIWPAYGDEGLRLEILDNKLRAIQKFHPTNGKVIESLESTVLYPAKHYLTAGKRTQKALEWIRRDLVKRLKELKDNGHELEAYRLEQRTKYDLEMISEVGYCNGIENYSQYFDGRRPGEPPFTLLNFFLKQHQKFLIIIDESHMTIPQIRGMYRGDQSRKQTLIDFGFRLPSALDNRPLKLEEFLERAPQIVCTSATPADWELNRVQPSNRVKPSNRVEPYIGLVEQLIRPTGLLDPEIEIRGTTNQIENLVSEIIKRADLGERVLVTTLTKRMAEDLSSYLKEQSIQACYLHADVKTLDRSDLLDDLRKGKYDVIVGINLLREGLDLPEVSLVAILDADKEGFLRSKTSLIQTMGRAARHVNGKVIMYADKVTKSMQEAINEVNRRRKIQEEYNEKYGIKPVSIQKPVRGKLIERPSAEPSKPSHNSEDFMLREKPGSTSQPTLSELETKMLEAAENLEFEKAAWLRDKIEEIKGSY
ncbi:excinuclease ABC subunit UvrB [Patescibacteria group bacterium]|nr:excinuclease ABC subunit UvrB [Patescibacteria group bacterium]